MCVTFEVTDEFAKGLLKTIPKKVTAWLHRLEILIDGEQTYTVDDGEFFISKKNGHITLGDTTLHWIGSPISPTAIFVNDKDLANLKINLESFIKLEKLIYNELQKIEDALEQNDANPEIAGTASTEKRWAMDALNMSSEQQEVTQ